MDNCTTELKRLALDALDIRVYASTDSTEIEGIMALELYLPTVEQMSASLFHCGYVWAEDKGFALAKAQP